MVLETALQPFPALGNLSMPLKWQDQELKQLKALALQDTALGTDPNWPAIADKYTAHPGLTPEGVTRSKDAIMQKGQKLWKVGLGVQPQNAVPVPPTSALMQEWAQSREAEVSAQEGTTGITGTAYTPDAEAPGV